MIAAAAMALSSISVVSNASRLRGFEPIEFEDVLEAELESGAPSVEVSQGQDDHEHHVEDSTVTDPVCGMTIDPRRPPPASNTRGRCITSAQTDAEIVL